MPKPSTDPHCVFDALRCAMNGISSEAHWDVLCDAECHRDALLDALSFIGTAMMDSTTSDAGHPFSQTDLNRLSGFLVCAPELIRGMNIVIETYGPPDTTPQ